MCHVEKYIYTYENIYVYKKYVCMYIHRERKLDDRSRGQHEGSFLNSYYTKVY